MNTNEKAASGFNGTASNQNYFADGKNKNFDFLNFRRNSDSMQCVKCRSDYMKFQKDGFCQDCQQKAEFIFREKLSPTQRQRFFRKPILEGARI